VRVDVQFQDRCSFPLTLKAYIISQQEKDSVPEWVPEDFLDPDAPPVRGLEVDCVCVCVCVCVGVCVRARARARAGTARTHTTVD
jgi:hypothetical protein